MIDNLIFTRKHKLRHTQSARRRTCLFITILIILVSAFTILPLYSAPVQSERVQDIVDNSTITRIQKPLAVRTDRETLEYFIEHVEELTKHGKDFKKKDLILEVKRNGHYGIQMPSKHITGEFALAEQQPQKAVYLGHGSATVFFNFSGAIVLKIDYTTLRDEAGSYEEVNTSVYLKFDNAFLGFIAKAASPLLNPKLDKLITKFATKTKKVVEAAYENKKRTK